MAAGEAQAQQTVLGQASLSRHVPALAYLSATRVVVLSSGKPVLMMLNKLLLPPVHTCYYVCMDTTDSTESNDDGFAVGSRSRSRRLCLTTLGRRS
jgi:hypothetical protein